MVWNICEIWKSYGNRLSEGLNSVRFYLTVWGMACMCPKKIYAGWLESYLVSNSKDSRLVE